MSENVSNSDFGVGTPPHQQEEDIIETQTDEQPNNK